MFQVQYSLVSQILFCNEKCAASRNHLEYECNLIHMVRSLDMGDAALLTVRIITDMGFAKLIIVSEAMLPTLRNMYHGVEPLSSSDRSKLPDYDHMTHVTGETLPKCVTECRVEDYDMVIFYFRKILDSKRSKENSSVSSKEQITQEVKSPKNDESARTLKKYWNKHNVLPLCVKAAIIINILDSDDFFQNTEREADLLLAYGDLILYYLLVLTK